MSNLSCATRFMRIACRFQNIKAILKDANVIGLVLHCVSNLFKQTANGLEPFSLFVIRTRRNVDYKDSPMKGDYRIWTYVTLGVQFAQVEYI